MTKPMNQDVNAVYNGILRPVEGAQQKVAFTDISAQSAVFKTDIVTLFATQNCWVRFGSNPTAAANDGNSVYLAAFFYHAFSCVPGEKLAVIRDSANGDLHIAGGA